MKEGERIDEDKEKNVRNMDKGDAGKQAGEKQREKNILCKFS